MDKINLDDYEEISRDEWFETPNRIGLARFEDENGVATYFKKKPEDVFESEGFKFKIHQDGVIMIHYKSDEYIMSIYDNDMDILEQAIEEAKRRRKNG